MTTKIINIAVLINWVVPDIMNTLNPAAIHLLETNPNKINWDNIGYVSDVNINYQYYLDNIVNHSEYILK